MMKQARNMTSKVSDNADLNAMIKALREAKVFNVERDNQAGTVVVTHPKTKLEVLRAIQNTKTKAWIVRHASNLFAS